MESTIKKEIIYEQPNNKKVIISQPINNKNNHKCLCEKIILQSCENKENPCCPVNINEWFNTFRIYINHRSHNDDGCFCGTICCPISFPILTTFVLPCTLYNIGRNKCNNTNNLNYLC